jgi:hypothetical protein
MVSKSFKVSVILGAVDKASRNLRNVALASAAVATAAVVAATKVVKAAAIQEAAETRLVAALKNVKGASEDGAKALITQAGAIQKLTGFSDAQIISAQAMLATFQLNETQIAAITPRLIDMAAATEKAEGQQADLQAIAIALGKGFTGQAGQLARYGVVLSEETKKTKDFNAIIKDLDANFKGIAEASGKTFTGQFRILKETTGDLMEVMGSFLLGPLTDIIKKLITATEKTIKFTTAIKKLIKESKSFNTVQKTTNNLVRNLVKVFKAVQAPIIAGTRFMTTFGKEGQQALDDLNQAIQEATEIFIESETIKQEKIVESAEHAKQIRDESFELFAQDMALREEMAIQAEEQSRAHREALIAAEEAKTARLIELSGKWADVFAGNINDMLKGTRTFAEGVQDIFQDVADEVVKQISRMIAKWIAFTALRGIAGILTGGISTLLGFANGTNFAPGGTAVVGERGPELVNLPRGSRVVSAPQTRQVLAGAGGMTLNVMVTGNTIMGDRGINTFSEKVSQNILKKVQKERNI